MYDQKKQLTFMEENEMVNNYVNKMHEYERRKSELMMSCKSCEELERALRKLAKELKV